MKTKILLFFVFMGLALIFPVSSVSQGNSEVHNAIKKLKERMGNDIKINYHGDGRVKTLDGKLSHPYPGTPEDAAKQFLKENAVVFKMEPEISDIEVEYSKETFKGYHHIRFKQTYKSLPVFNGGAEVHIDKNNSIFLAHNYYLPNINISTMPTLSEKDVVEIAKNDHLTNCQYYPDKTWKPQSCTGMAITFKDNPYIQLGIFEHKGKPYLIYKVFLDVEFPPAYLEYIVDANNGIMLEGGGRNLIKYFSGTGTVFDPNPVNTLYSKGIQLQDNNDRNDPNFNGAYFTNALNSITFANGSYSLIGPYVDVTDSLEGPFYFKKTSGYILSTSGNFNFTRQPNEFEHVMTYYHIDTNQNYIQSFGFIMNKRQIKVDPHILGNNSFYKPSPVGAGYLAFGEGGVDDAEDADVILHEYGHAIQDNVAPGKYDSGICNPLNSCNNCQFPEAAAMGEGFGDYWAASNTYDISIANGFDPACIGEWDDAPNCLRRLDSTKHYPEAIVKECHADGEIWSAALWDMFKYPGLGKTTTDTLVLWSHSLIPDNPTFCNGAKAILQADEQLYGSANKNVITDVMINRGINVNISDPIISGPDAPVDGDKYTATGGAPPYTWSISKGSITPDGVVTVSGQCGSATITVTDGCGTASKDVRMPSGVWVIVSVLEDYSSSCGVTPEEGHIGVGCYYLQNYYVYSNAYTRTHYWVAPTCGMIATLGSLCYIANPPPDAEYTVYVYPTGDSCSLTEPCFTGDPRQNWLFGKYLEEYRCP